MSPRLAVLLPDLGKGVRAAIATVVPFYLARALERPELAWVALAGWLAALADPGGSRRVRAEVLGLFVAGGALAVLVGTACATSPVTSALFVLAATFATSLMRAFGGNAATTGTTLAIVVVIAAQAVTAAPVQTAGYFALGATWAVLLSSLVWPGRPHLPLRHAVARVYGELAEYVDAIAEAFARGDDETAWAAIGREHQRKVRAALEAARATMVQLRARRFGATTVGTNTRMVLGEAEAELFRLIAYAEELEAQLAGRGHDPNGAPAADDPWKSPTGDAAVLAELARNYREIRDQLFTRRGGTWRPDADVASPSRIGRELIDGSRVVVDVTRDLDRTPEVTYQHAPGLEPATGAPGAPAAIDALRDALAWHSPTFHHAARVAIVAAVALVIGRISSPRHAQWVSITAVAVLQPYLGPTIVRVVERVIGTIFGCAIAIGLIATLATPLATSLAMFPLAVIAVVTRPRSYRLFVLFLTPVFLLVADRWHPSFETALVRIADVALGGALAVVAALIRPSWERARLPDAVAGALDAVAAYVRIAFGGGDHAALVAARRAVGVALETAEASLERMFAEPQRLQRGTAEAVMLLTYARRISGGLTALGETGALGGAAGDDVRDYLLAELAAAKRFVTDGETAPARTPPVAAPALARLVHHGELVGRVAVAAPPATA